VKLPNFDKESVNWGCNSDWFRFEREDIAKTWSDSETNYQFYKLVFTDCGIVEKIVIFDGDSRVGYVSWTEGYEIHGLYVMPSYRSRGIGKKLLSFVPPGLKVWVMDFTLIKSEERGLPYHKLVDFYNTHYFGINNETSTPNSRFNAVSFLC
jgi:GNAT superfamily N-acetyltransferase